MSIFKAGVFQYEFLFHLNRKQIKYMKMRPATALAGAIRANMAGYRAFTGPSFAAASNLSAIPPRPLHKTIPSHSFSANSALWFRTA